MEWSEENILGRGHCRNKDTEELRGFFFVFFLKQGCYWHFGQDCYRTLPTPQLYSTQFISLPYLAPQNDSQSFPNISKGPGKGGVGEGVCRVQCHPA